MIMQFPIVSFDPSLANFGMAALILDFETMQLSVQDLVLTETERRVNKMVRQNSDDLRRARDIHATYTKFAQRGKIAFVEIPTGAQSARAAFAFGATVGLLAACPVPIIQLQPSEVKLATVGTKTASKEEMIEWATKKYPDAPWLRTKAGRLLNSNEHLADAVAIAHAGIVTDQFLQLVAMIRKNAA